MPGHHWKSAARRLKITEKTDVERLSVEMISSAIESHGLEFKSGHIRRISVITNFMCQLAGPMVARYQFSITLDVYARVFVGEIYI